MRFFDEEVGNSNKAPVETIVIIPHNEAKLIIEALKFKIENESKTKNKKLKKIFNQMQEKWSVY